MGAAAAALATIATTHAACAGVSSDAAEKIAQSNPQGMVAFNDHCRECHSYLPNDNRLGPSLWGVVGRKAGSEPGFAYSDSLKNTDFSWTPTVLAQWITNPNAVVSGNNMGSLFSGLEDAAARTQIVSFLQTISPAQASDQSATKASDAVAGGVKSQGQIPATSVAPATGK